MIKYCMRCLTELTDETRKECFKCKRVTCSNRDCGIWAVKPRFWSCHICVDDDINALIDMHDNKLEPKDEEEYP